MPKRVQVPENPPAEEYPGDDLTEEEVEQAEVGDLITIQGPQFDSVSWSIWRHRTRQEMANDTDNGQPMEWVADRTGQLHGADMVELLGGGTFQLRGYVPRDDGRGVRMKYNRTVSIAGPRKNFAVVAVPPTPTAPTNGAGLTRIERIMLRMLKRFDQRLDQIERAPAPSSAAPSLKDLADTLETLDKVRSRNGGAPPANPDKEVVATMMELVEKGIELGQMREPSASDPSATDWGKIFETALPIVSRALDRMSVRRPPPPASRPPGTPVEPAAPPTVTPGEKETPVVNHRLTTAVESLANAIAEGDDPIQFAITLEAILNKQEVAMLRAASLEQVMGEMGTAASAFPILVTDQAKVFIEAVLAELKNPTLDAEQ